MDDNNKRAFGSGFWGVLGVIFALFLLWQVMPLLIYWAQLLAGK